jgi:hypothetical protein
VERLSCNGNNEEEHSLIFFANVVLRQARHEDAEKTDFDEAEEGLEYS